MSSLADGFSAENPRDTPEGMMTDWLACLQKNLGGTAAGSNQRPPPLIGALTMKFSLTIECRRTLLRMMADFVEKNTKTVWAQSSGANLVARRLEVMIDALGASIRDEDWRPEPALGVAVLDLYAALQETSGMRLHSNAGSLAVRLLNKGYSIPESSFERVVGWVVADLERPGVTGVADRCADSLARVSWENFYRARTALKLNDRLRPALCWDDGRMAAALIHFWNENETEYYGKRVNQALTQLHDCLAERRVAALLRRWPDLRGVDGFNQSWERLQLQAAAKEDVVSRTATGIKRSL